MYDDVIFISAVIVVLFMIWLALKLNVLVRKQKVEQIKHIDLTSYVTFINNFNQGEEAQKKGDKNSARHYFQLALNSLKEEENPDEMVLEAIADMEKRIASLDE